MITTRSSPLIVAAVIGIVVSLVCAGPVKADPLNPNQLDYIRDHQEGDCFLLSNLPDDQLVDDFTDMIYIARGRPYYMTGQEAAWALDSELTQYCPDAYTKLQIVGKSATVSSSDG